MDTAGQEIVASAFAAAVTVVGLLKGITYVTDRKSSSDEKAVTMEQCNNLRIACAQQRSELKTDTALYRADTKEDTRIYRAEARQDSIGLDGRLNAMQKEIKSEIVELGKKVDELLRGLRKFKSRQTEESEE